MDTIVMRERKSALIIGIICTLLFTAFGLFFAMIEAGIALLFFLPFILLGASVILIYYRHFIILETDRMTVSEPFRKKKVIFYSEIGTVLVHTLNTGIELILISRAEERLMKFAAGMTDSDKALDLLTDREIPFVGLSELIESGQGIGEYLPVLTKWEQFFYRPQIRIMENARRIEASHKAGTIKKEKHFVKITGRFMIGAEIFAFFFLRGKLFYACFIFILLLAWGMYIWMYPNLFLEVSKEIKGRDYMIKMPLFSISIAALSCLLTAKGFDFDETGLFVFVGIYAILLLLPFVVKLYLTRQKPDKLRLLLIVFAALALAFITAVPVNVLTTFKVDRHEPIIVKEKETYTGSKTTDYNIYADWREDNQRFTVSESRYNEIRKGDRLQVCLRHSIFGLHYWTIHN